MDDLVKMVSAKTGLPPEMAKTAVMMVIDYLKKQLPPPLAAQLDGIVAGGGAPGASGMDAIVKGLGGMLGGGK